MSTPYKAFKDMTPEEQAKQQRLWALEEEAERRKTQKRAKVAIRNLSCLEEVLRDYLRAHEDNPEWQGPGPHEHWTLDLGQSSETSLTLHYQGWDGCHCHGRQTDESVTIPVDDLFQNLEEIGARFRERKAQKEREERAARERAEKKREADEKAAQEKADREQYARLQAKFGAGGV